MIAVLPYMLLLLLLYVFFTDFTQLALSIWVFPVLWLGWMLLHFFALGGDMLWRNGLVNSLLLGGSVWVLRTYARWRMGRFLNTAFGLGDLLFLAAFAWAYPPPIFLGLWLLGTLASLLIAVLLVQDKVPYAGYLALANALAIALDLYSPRLTLYPIHP